MADKALTALTAATGAAKTNLLLITEDPSGTPASKTITISQLFSLADGTRTTDTPILDFTQTWNSGGVTFNAIKVNVTDTASASGSKLIDLQIGGSSKLNVTKAGLLTIAGALATTTITAAGGTITASTPALTATQTWNSGGVTFKGISLDVTDTASAAGSLLIDLLVASSSKFSVAKSGAIVTASTITATQAILSGGTITASTPGIDTTQTWNSGGVTFTAVKVNITDTASAAASLLVDYQVASSSKFNVSKAGAATLASSITTTQAVVTTGTITASTPALSGTQTWNSAGVTFKGISLTVTDTASAAASLLIDLLVGASSKFSVTKGGVCTAPEFKVTGASELFSVYSSGTNQTATLGDDGSGNSRLKLASGGAVAWSNSATGVGTLDLFLLRESANILGQRNGTTGQISRIYNTFTDTSNYERAILGWSSNIFLIATSAGGTGTARSILITAASALSFSGGGSLSAQWQVTSSGHFVCGSDATYDIGASGATRPRNIFISGDIACDQLASANGTFLRSTVALTNGAAAGAGTITNAPSAGNPTKWIPIDDNGTTRYIPCW